MLTDPGCDDLSRREIRKLVEVSDRYRDFEDEEIGDLTHEFQEYLQNYVVDSSRTISLQSKLEALEITGSQESIETDIEAIVRVYRGGNQSTVMAKFAFLNARVRLARPPYGSFF